MTNMTHKLTTLILSAAISLGVGMVAVQPAGAIDIFDDACTGDNANTTVCRATGTDDAQNIVQRILSLLFWAIGIISVLMIVLGGFRYVTSNGDSSRIQAAKNTIMYAVIGLVVAILGQAVVLFVTNWLRTGSGT